MDKNKNKRTTKSQLFAEFTDDDRRYIVDNIDSEYKSLIMTCLAEIQLVFKDYLENISRLQGHQILREAKQQSERIQKGLSYILPAIESDLPDNQNSFFNCHYGGTAKAKARRKFIRQALSELQQSAKAVMEYLPMPTANNPPNTRFHLLCWNTLNIVVQCNPNKNSPLPPKTVFEMLWYTACEKSGLPQGDNIRQRIVDDAYRAMQEHLAGDELALHKWLSDKSGHKTDKPEIIEI